MRIRIEGSDLPGARVGAEADALRLGEVHVGVQRDKETVDRVPVSAASASWAFEVRSRLVDGMLDVGGPFVHGRPGARFLYLTWESREQGVFAMFRRAKLLFGDIPGALLRSAHDGDGVLVGRLGLTGADGTPVCARVRPPAITWSLE